MTEEQKEKYANFVDKVSEILGLNKPVDILRLCAVTDEYLRPIEKHITELEKENAELKSIADFQTSSNMDRYSQLKRSEDMNKTIERKNRAKMFLNEVRKLAESYDVNFFCVSDGASETDSIGNDCVEFHFQKQKEWEK